jgi:hypothetical protein
MKIEDGFIAHGQIVWCPGAGRVSVARVLEVSLPSLESASVDYCNRLETELAALIRMLPPEVMLQAVWAQDLDFGPLLSGYYQDTQDLAARPWVRRERNAVFVEQTERDRRGELRGERLLIVLRMPFAGGVGALTDEALKSSRKAFDLWLAQIRETVGRLGGIAEQPDDAELFERVRDYVDPALGRTPHTDRSNKTVPLQSLGDILPGDLVGEEGLGFYCGGKHHGFVALSALPQATCSGIIAHLLSLTVRNYSLTLNLRAGNPAKEIEAAEARKTKLERAHRSGRNTRLEHAIDALRERIRSLASGEAFPARVQLILRVHDESADVLRSRLTALRTAIARMQGAVGHEVSLPTTARNLFLAGMPGAPMVEEAFWHQADDRVAANLLPMTGDAARSLERAQAIFQTVRGGLFGIRIFGGAEGHSSPRHAFVTGMTGSGKSAFLIALLTQTDPFIDYTVIIDDGLSYATFVQVTTGGKVQPVILAVDGSETINFWDTAGMPFGTRNLADTVAVLHLMAGHRSDEDADRLREAVLVRCVRRFAVEWAERWLQAQPDRRSNLERILRGMARFAAERGITGEMVEQYARFYEWAVQNGPEAEKFTAEALSAPYGPDPDPDSTAALAFARMSPDEMPTHSDFHDWLQAEEQSEIRDRTEIGMLVTLLDSWRSDRGAKGRLLDGVNTVNLSAPYVHLELGRLGEADSSLKAIVSHIIAGRIRDEIVRRPRSQKKRVVIEELGGFLKLDGGERLVAEFYERMRKKNAFVVTVIQQASSLPEKMARSILGNTFMAFIFRQKEQGDLDALQRAFRLPDNAVEAIRRFHEPDAARGAPFLCWEGLGEHDRITLATNRATREMLYVSGSGGDLFEKRRAALSKYDDVLEGVVAEAWK